MWISTHKVPVSKGFNNWSTHQFILTEGNLVTAGWIRQFKGINTPESSCQNSQDRTDEQQQQSSTYEAQHVFCPVSFPVNPNQSRQMAAPPWDWFCRRFPPGESKNFFFSPQHSACSQGIVLLLWFPPEYRRVFTLQYKEPRGSCCCDVAPHKYLWIELNWTYYSDPDTFLYLSCSGSIGCNKIASKRH